MDYLDDVMLDCHLRNLHRTLLREEYDKVSFSILGIINQFRKAKEIKINSEIVDHALTELMHMRIECSVKNFRAVHNRIRDLHYMLVKHNLNS